MKGDITIVFQVNGKSKRSPRWMNGILHELGWYFEVYGRGHRVSMDAQVGPFSRNAFVMS